MSYSFYVKAQNKTELKEAVRRELDTVCETQPMHKTEKDHVLTVVDAFIDLLSEKTDRTYGLSLNGSIGWTGDNEITGVGMGISVSFS